MALWDGGHYSGNMLRGLGPSKPLRDCNVEEVAAYYARKPESGGQLFDAKIVKSEKRLARECVVDLFGLARFPGPIRVLTMPGMKWSFEAALLRERETPHLSCRDVVGPEKTEFHCFENDRGIYYNAMLTPPGIRHPRNAIADLGADLHCERVTSSLWIKRYCFTDVNAIVLHKPWMYDAVWLDYLGPLTVDLLSSIATFFETSVTSTIVITSLRARWNDGVAAELKRHSSYTEWVRSLFAGHYEEHCVEYFDTSPMLQVAYSKRKSETRSLDLQSAA